LNTANANIALIFGVDATQNANIALALTTANTAASNTVVLQGGLNTANANIAFVLPRANAGYNFLNTGGTINGPVIISGNLNVTGSISYTGNVTSVQITGNSGQFFGYSSNGFNALYTGIPTGYFIEPQITVQVSSNYNGYSGINMQNINPGANSSSDLFITADNGTVNDGFLDLGMSSSNYSYTGYTLIGKNDGYLFTTGNTTTGGGNMIVGTGLNNDIIFTVGGIDIENEIARFKYNNGLVLKQFPIKFADGTTQNTAAASNAYSIAAFNTANSAASNTVTLQGGLNTANANISLIFGALSTANANIATLFAIDNAINTAVQIANTTANSAASNTVVLQGGLNTANANITLLISVNDTQNANIALALTTANNANSIAYGAFNKANTDVTSISITPGTYGDSGNVAVITVAANGRIVSVTNTAITASGGGGGVSASGYLANSIIFANTTGYLSNTSGLQFISTNNTVITSNVQLSSGITFADGTRQTTASSGGGGGSSVSANAEIIYVIDGSGLVLSTGFKGALEVPFNCTINGFTMLADQSGNVAIQINKDTYTNALITFSPLLNTGANTINLVNQIKNTSTTLTGWNTTINTGDILTYNVSSILSPTNITRLSICLKVTKS
jgi:hypothetical protein